MTGQPRDEANRYDQLGPEARALVDDFDALDLAEMLVSKKNDIAACTAQQWPQRLAAAEVERDEARATNHRLNHDKQRLESELAAYRRAVGQWEVSERGTYVPLRTIAAIAKAAGRDMENPRWLLHYQRVEQAEAANARVRTLTDQWIKAGPPPLGTPVARWWDARLAELNAALDEKDRT